jgi:sugar transferase (PEP-CTERM/EpsH1 system associated)
MNNNKVVVHLVVSFDCGGLEKVICNLVNESTQCKHVIISAMNNLEMASQIPSNVEIYTLNKKPGKDLMCHFRLHKLLLKIKPHVLHTYNFSTIEYHWIAKLSSIKVHVHAEHGYGGDHPQGLSKIKNTFRRITSSLLTNYVVVSQDLKNWAVDHVKMSNEDVEIVFNGVEVPESCGQLSERRFTRNTPFELVTIGRLAEVKNQAMLIQAIEKIQKEQPDIHINLSIVGDGPMRPSLSAMIERLPSPCAVTLHGIQYNIQSFLDYADGFVLSSLYEAMPMTVLEAMAACRPVICPLVGGVSDFISTKEAILPKGNDLDALTKAIITLYHMPHNERESLSIRGYNRVKNNYSVTSMTKNYEMIYLA